MFGISVSSSFLNLCEAGLVDEDDDLFRRDVTAATDDG
jgi:hypothetical protein